jgi:hypothetical protein
VLGKRAVLLEVDDVSAERHIDHRERGDGALDRRRQCPGQAIGEGCARQARQRRLARKCRRRIEWHMVSSGKSQALIEPLLGCPILLGASNWRLSVVPAPHQAL